MNPQTNLWHEHGEKQEMEKKHQTVVGKENHDMI